MNEKVRRPIIWFATFSSLMLFQTSYLRLGTITAFGTLVLCVLATVLGGYTSLSHFRFPRKSQLLLAFVLLSVLVTVFTSHMPNYFDRYIAQIFLFIVLSSIVLNQKEVNLIRNTFIVAAVFYAALTIYSCIQAGNTRYVHSDIMLFNTYLDPNFIGIPFVAASGLVLDYVLRGKNRIINIFFYAVLAIATVYTSSRSNLVCFAVSTMLVIINYMTQRKVKLWIRLFWIILTIVAIIGGIRFISVEYSGQWQRMIAFGVGSDNGRFILWRQSFDAFLKSPLWGNGLGYMVTTYGKATHNTYLQLLCETGIIGFALFISFILVLLHELRYIDKIYTIFLASMLIQIAFLDALDNRCFWIVLCWMSMMPLELEENLENADTEEVHYQSNSKVQTKTTT